jgi:hypothetical protein
MNPNLAMARISLLVEVFEGYYLVLMSLPLFPFQIS